jgi:hypothetical protein
MGTLILLSSSPPRPFARSPTPTASSSPSFASPSSIFGNGHKRFKSASVQRDGFSTGSNTARSILGTKVGSENIPFGVTKSQRSSENTAKGLRTKLTSVDSLREDGAMPGAGRGARVASAETSVEERGMAQPASLAATKTSGEDAAGSVFTTETHLQPQSRALSPLLRDKVPFRRLDWTPPKRDPKNTTELGLEEEVFETSFPGGLLKTFGYEGESAGSSFSSRDTEGCPPTKRRRLDFVDNGSRKPSNATATLKLAPASKSSETAPRKRNKSPKKKHTTITGIATARYLGEDQGERETGPMHQYLAATQARDIGDSQEPPPDTKRKRAPKETKAKKKPLPTPVLLSPESALKAIDSQDTLFGSASQLARDESPTFIRDTAGATKQSESSFTSTPVPTQNTIPSEPGSTTRRGNQGTSRFVKSRNLWATASRDHDNALLQIDTIDLFDSPDLRHAFTGKDAMLEPTASRDRELGSLEKALPTLSGGHLGRLEIPKGSGWLDIDDIGITTPTAHVMKNTFTQRRTIHVASEPPAKGAKSSLDAGDVHEAERIKQPSAGDLERQQSAPVSAGVSSLTEPSRLQMPAFNGFTTGELSNQLKKYGFKPIKKREKMIEVLQSCWEAKHQSKTNTTSQMAVGDAPGEELEVATHGGILSKVHGLATRPTPKVPKKKIPAPRDRSATPAQPAGRKAGEGDEDTGKTPKQRKKAERNAKEPKNPKASGKRKSKASALSTEHVIDISDIEDTTIDKPHNPPSSPPVTSGQAGCGIAMQSAACLPTPPLTLPPNISAESDEATPRPLESCGSDLPDINSQITDAIRKYVPSPTRDHQRDPTWHEKILMYDPIVLEDLAAWLNTEGLGLIGEDREVSALDVRSWCEMKGVCCYGVGGGWRGNVKGKAKARGGEVGD